MTSRLQTNTQSRDLRWETALLFLFAAMFGTTTQAADGPTTFSLKTYNSPVVDDPINRESITSTALDQALPFPFPNDFVEDLMVDAFDSLDDYKQRWAGAIEEIVEDSAWESGGHLDLEADAYNANVTVSGNPILISLANPGSSLSVVLGGVGVNIDTHFRGTIFGQVRLGSCKVKIRLRNVELEFRYDVVTGSREGTRVKSAKISVEDIDCERVAMVLEIFEDDIKRIAQEKVAEAMDEAAEEFADETNALFGLSDLADALDALPDWILSDTLEQLRDSIVELIEELSDYDGSGFFVHLELKDNTSSNSVRVTIRAPSPTPALVGSEHVALYYVNDPDFVEHVDDWIKLGVPPRFLSVSSYPGTVQEVYVERIGEDPTDPTSGSNDPRWYAIGAYSDEIESIWSEPQYIQIACIAPGFIGCFD